MKMSKHPSWIQKLDFLLPKGLRESPFGDIPRLHLNQLEPILKKHLHTSEVAMELDSISTLDLESIYKDLGPEPFIQAIHLEPTHHSIFLLFKAADVDKGHSFLTQGKLPPNDEVLKGVVKFLSLKGLSAIEELHLFKGLNMTLTTQFPHDGLYEVFDLTINLPGLSLSPRLIVGEAALKALKEFYLKHPTHHAEPKPHIPVPLHLELGSIPLTKEEIQSLEKLDLIHLDHISKEVLNHHYHVTLTYKNTALMSGYYKDHLIQGFSPITTKPQERIMPSGGPSDKDFSDLEEDFEPLDDLENEENEEIEEDDEASFPPTVALKKIALDCKIELGAVNIPYETLSNLTHESTVPVDLDPKQVYLTLNGQILHRGEIVEFDHQLFFKVLE